MSQLTSISSVKNSSRKEFREVMTMFFSFYTIVFASCVGAAMNEGLGFHEVALHVLAILLISVSISFTAIIALFLLEHK